MARRECRIVLAIKYLLTYGLCLYYNVKYAVAVVYLFIRQRHTKFWVVKERPEPPQCMLNPELGEHKYVTVNVSISF